MRRGLPVLPPWVLHPAGAGGATFCGSAVRGLARLRFAPLTQSRPGSRFWPAQLFLWALLPRPLAALGGSSGACRPTEGAVGDSARAVCSLGAEAVPGCGSSRPATGPLGFTPHHPHSARGHRAVCAGVFHPRALHVVPDSDGD